MAKGKNLTNYDSNVLLTGTAYADTVYNHHGNCSKIILGAGDDTFVNIRSDYVTVNGGTGNDVIEFDQYSTDAVIEYAAGGGNDTIYGYNLTDTVKLSGGSITDTLLSDGNLVLKIGTGSITFVDAISVNINGTIINTTPTKGTKGNDNINNFFSDVTINGYGGNDTIGNGGSNVLINAGSGNNSIGNYGDDVLINAGNGNNSIANYGYDSTIITGDGNNTIYNDDSALIVSGAGNDLILNDGYYVKITAGAGNDSIENNGYNNTIGGGKGNDFISLGYSDDNLIVYRAGDGKDVVHGYNSSDTIGIVGSYTTSTVGNDILIKVGKGSIRLKDAKDETLNIVSTKTLLMKGTNGNDTIESVFDGATILGNGGNDSIYNKWGNNASYIDGGVGNDTIENGDTDDCNNEGGDNVTINGSAGNDSINNGECDDSTINGGDGADSITNSYGTNLSIDGGAGDDSIYNNYDGSNVSIDGGAGNDYIENDDGQNDKITGGAGNDSIYNYDGDNVTIDGGKGNDYLYNRNYYDSSGSNISISGGSGNDTINSWGDSVKIDGGKGDDSINNEDGENVLFVYNSGDGNDSISGFNATSTLSIGGAKYTSTTSGDDLIFTVGKGKITLDGAANLSTVNIIGEEVPTLKTVTNSTPSPVTIDASIKTVDASKRTKAVQITGNKLANSIVGGSKADTLDGGGNDTLTGGKGKDLFVYTAGKDVITDYATGDKISVGGAISKASVSGSDVVFKVGKGTLTVNNAKDKSLALIDSKGKSYTATVGNAMAITLTNATKSPVTLDAAIKTVDASKRTKAVQITGNKLANSIVGGKSNDTLAGGKGNDSLWGGKGKDTFIYDAGDGKDIIYGFGKNDLLQITGAFSAGYNASKKEVAFKVGKGSVTLRDFGSTTLFHVNSDTYQLSGGKLSKK